MKLSNIILPLLPFFSYFNIALGHGKNEEEKSSDSNKYIIVIVALLMVVFIVAGILGLVFVITNCKRKKHSVTSKDQEDVSITLGSNSSQSLGAARPYVPSPHSGPSAKEMLARLTVSAKLTKKPSTTSGASLKPVLSSSLPAEKKKKRAAFKTLSMSVSVECSDSERHKKKCLGAKCPLRLKKAKSKSNSKTDAIFKFMPPVKKKQ